MEDMRWYIFSDNNEPLCWGDDCCVFDTEEDAVRFKKALLKLPQGKELGNMNIKNCIFFYDFGARYKSGLKRNMSGLQPIQSDNNKELALERWR